MRTEWEKVEADVDRVHRLYMRETRPDNGDDFNIIYSSGLLFEQYIKRVYGEEITADQRHRLCIMMDDILKEVKGQQMIDWKNSKVIPFKRLDKR